MKRIVLESIEGVEIYPIISLIIFTSMFLVALIYTIKMDKNTVNKIASIPLVNEDNNKEISHDKA